jgi:hypothetical protein
LRDTRPAYEDESGQYIVVDGERIDDVWLVPEEHPANAPVLVPAVNPKPNGA